MLRQSSVALFALLLLLAPSAHATQIFSVDQILQGTDGNFQFSVIHTSSSGNDGQSGSILGSIGLAPDGGTWSVTGGIGTLDVDLVVDFGGGSVATYRALGQFDVSALADFTNQADVMLGSLSFTYESGDAGQGLGGLTFYFEDRNYSSAGDPPNGLAGDLLTLWGATEFTGSGVLGEPLDLVAGGRGIDLRVGLGPAIPEPSARPLFLAGLTVVGLGALRLRRQA